MGWLGERYCTYVPATVVGALAQNWRRGMRSWGSESRIKGRDAVEERVKRKRRTVSGEKCILMVDG